jgi:hypothetical protein
MNKYLLLRDNKQSGPYTADELSVKGIKPYDLVWLEGKSAAWRYPGEIEELKAFAPIVEEQPFDRFYKKPECTPQIDIIAETGNSRFEPKPETATVSQLSKKVYINFPGGQQKRIETKPITVQEPVVKAQMVEEPKYISSAPAYASRKKNNNIIYGAVALIVLVVVSYLAINYNKQRQDINQLNALLQQLEQKNAQASIIAPVTGVVEEKADPAEPLINTVQVEEKPVTDNINKPVKQQAPIQAKNIIFKESRPSPLVVEDKKQEEVKSENAPIHENLFKLVSVKSNKYKTGVLGGISNLQLEITNNSPQQLQKVAVVIKYLGPEKRLVKTQTVYFENIAPGAQTSKDVPKSNRGVTIDYAITDIKS